MSDVKSIDGATISDLYDDYAKAVMGSDEKPTETVPTVQKDVAEKTQEIAQEVVKAEIAHETAPKSEVAKADTVAQEVIQNTEITPVETTQEVVQTEEVTKEVAPEKPTAEAPQKAPLPPLALRRITRGEVRKMDTALVDQHIPRRTRAIRWDAARQVVVITKSRKTRAYQIGHGSGPALIESRNKSFVLDHLNRM